MKRAVPRTMRHADRARRWRGAAAFMALAGLCLASACGRSPASAPGCAGGACFSSARTLDGRPLRLVAGAPALVVNFWAGYCGPCVAELPLLAAAHAAHRAEGVEFVGVLLDSDERAAQAKATRAGVGYPIVRASFELERAVGFPAFVPVTRLYDRDGRLVQTWERQLREGELDARLRSVLATAH